MAKSIIEQKSVALNTDSPVTTKRRRRTLQSKTSIDNSIYYSIYRFKKTQANCENVE